MKILSLKLRGAIGIKKGAGLDEIEIDFSDLNPGIVALTGKNGSGKTTIMENLHPYRQMVSRPGSLQSHFYLKNSYRILAFSYGEKIYQSKILIDALTGGSEAYLYEDGKCITDGKLTTYDTAIESLLGSPELFFNSVFSGQKSKGIAELKPADRKKLLFELLNLSHYESLNEKAKVQQRNAELQIADIDGEMRSLTNGDTDSLEMLEHRRSELMAKINPLEAELIDNNSKIKVAQEAIVQANVKISEAKRLVEDEKEVEKRKDARRVAESNLAYEIDSRTKQHESIIEHENKIIERAAKLTENQEKIDAAIKEISELEAKRTEFGKVLDELKNIEVDISKKSSAWLQRKSELTTQLNRLEKEAYQMESDINNIDKQVNESKSQSEIIGKVPCDEFIGKTCQFLLNAFERRISIPKMIEERERLTLDHTAKRAEFEKLAKQFADEQSAHNQSYQMESDIWRNRLQETNAVLKPITDRYQELKRTNWNTLRDEAAKADTQIQLANQAIEAEIKAFAEMEATWKARKDLLQTELEWILSHVTLYSATKELYKAENDLFEAQNVVTNHSALISRITDSINFTRSTINLIDNQITEQRRNSIRLSELEELANRARQELKEWAFLSKAFDKTGIPVLKLENSGIEITSIANDLLSLFDNKFRIAFETTALTKDKKKQKETFDINIIDEDGICEISNKSGGQQVWLETAIQLAISLVVRRQGRNLQTAFLDEKDGALDLENAYNYISMLKKAHEMSRVHNTFIITHRTELLDMIEQKVVVRDGSVEVVC